MGNVCIECQILHRVKDLDSLGFLLEVFTPSLLNPAILVFMWSASLSCYIRSKTGWWN